MAATSSTTITPGFMVLHGNRLEDLRDLTLDWMRHYPLHPMQRTTFLVQSNGIAQWLKSSIAESQEDGRGVCMAVDVMLPARFQWLAYRQVVEAVEGPGSVPTTSPYDKTRLRWRLMKLLPSRLDDPLFASLKHFLGDDPDQRKCYQLAERLADLFDQYQVYRADWLAAWARGEDILITPQDKSKPIPEDQFWQPQLWRDIGDSMSESERSNNRASIHHRFLEAAGALTPDTRPAGIPPRLVVFGISSLPHQTLEALSALSHVTQVMLCTVNPCQHYWGDIIEHKELLRREYRRQKRKDGMPVDLKLEDMHLHAHPLLAAWGKQGRDYLHLLAEHDDTTRYAEAFETLGQRVDVFASPDTSLQLGQLQDDILNLRPIQETQSQWSAIDPAEDRSVVFHVAHSPQRELEVLHDQLLAAFDADHRLQPRDIIVMMPDVTEFAPHIHAVFGQYDHRDDRHIPYQVADQRQRHREPLMVAMEILMSLPKLRFRASEILDLLEVPAVRQRFGIQESDLPTLQRWVQGANIHWGIDARQRASLDLPEHDELHTWRFGLERMLMGYAVGEPDLERDDWQGIVPYDEVAGLDAALVGPLYRLIDTLDRYREVFSESLTAQHWSAYLQRLMADILDASSPREETLLGQLQDSLETWLEEIEEAGFDGPLPLAIVRESWLSRIDEPLLSQRFLGGSVTFATLMPMRAIPFRHVCLLGMNDGKYPRRAETMDFDLMAGRGQYRPGDRSRREDDRYLFLEALLSARERLYISWSGRSLQDNSDKPASVLVGQLRDHLANGWRMANAASLDKAGEALLEAQTTYHPLQPFGEDYFRADTPLFTYASEWESVHADPSHAASTDDAPLLPRWVPDNEITLHQLGEFLRDPVSAFFRQRLKIHLRDEDDLSEDDEPFGFAGLSKWQQQNALLQPLGQQLAMSPDLDLDEAIDSLLDQRQRAGDYPPAPVGSAIRQDILKPLPATLERYRELLRDFPDPIVPTPEFSHSVEVESRSQDDDASSVTLQLREMLDQLHRAPDGATARIVLSTSRAHRGSSRHWNNIIKHWPAHLALQLVAPGASSHIVTPSGTLELAGLEKQQAEQWLNALVKHWFHGMQRITASHADLGFKVLDADAWDMESITSVKGLRQELDKAFDYLPGRSPLFIREFPTLESLVEHPRFAEDTQALYADIHRSLTPPAKESAQ